jgi:hypothetical protein
MPKLLAHQITPDRTKQIRPAAVVATPFSFFWRTRSQPMSSAKGRKSGKYSSPRREYLNRCKGWQNVRATMSNIGVVMVWKKKILVNCELGARSSNWRRHRRLRPIEAPRLANDCMVSWERSEMEASRTVGRAFRPMDKSLHPKS